AVALDRRRREIQARHVAVRQRVERGDLQADRVEKRLRDLTAGKRRRRIHSGNERLLLDRKLRKIAQELSRRRYVGQARDAFAEPRAFVVAEEKRAVFKNRASQGESELVALISRVGLIGRGEEIARVEDLVAKEFIGRAVNPISPRFQNDVDLRARAASERSVVCAGQDLEFADRVDRRFDAEGVELRVYVVDAVEQEVVGVLARAVDVECEIAAHRTGGALSGRRGPGREQAQLQKVPAVERQPRYLPVVYHCA